jgi:hypothetical protein
VLTPEQRRSIENGIFLCTTCAKLIDRNNGADFPAPLLREWKADHEEWVRSHLNKSPYSLVSEIAGEYRASGVGIIVGLDAEGPVIIKPGTRVSAQGIGHVSAARFGPKGGRQE